MAGQALKELYENLRQQGSNIIINSNNNLAAQMLKELKTFFNIEALSLSGCQISEPDANNNFSVVGIANLLNFIDKKIKITFFTAHKISDEVNEKVECIIEFIDNIQTWNLTQDFPNMPEYLNVENLVEKFEPSFLKELNFSAPGLFFSTVDFVNSEADKIIVSLEEKITCGSNLLKKGLSFTAGAAAEAGTFWDTVKEVVKGLDVLDVIASITTDAYGELVLLVEQELRDKSFKITEDVSLALKKLYIKGGLTKQSLMKPVVVVDAELIHGQQILPFTVEIDIGRKVLVISSKYETGKVLPITEILAIAGVKNLSLADYLPEGCSVEYFSETGLLNMRFEIALSPFCVNFLGFSFGTVNPWKILDERISIKPIFDWKIQNPFDEALRKIDIDITGEWNLGSTLMNIFALPKTGEISARMLPGDLVDIGALVQAFLPGIKIPEIPFGELCLTANYLTKSFYLFLESAGTWSFDVGFGKIDIYEAWLLIDYKDGKFKDFCIGGFVNLAGNMIEIQAQYSQTDGWTLEGGTAIENGMSAETMINGIINGFEGLAGKSASVNIPDSFLPVKVSSLYLKYQSKTNTFSFYTDLTYSFSLGGYLSSDEAVLQLELDSSGLKDACILVKFNVCGVDMELKIRKEENGEWSIDGGTEMGAKMSLADLTNGLIDSFKNITGLSFPNIPDSFLPVDVKSLYLKYINKTKQLSISADLDYSFSIGEFFTGGEGKLQLEFDNTGLKDGSIVFKLDVCGVDMELKMTKRQNGEWSIEGGTALGEKMSVANLVNGLIGSFKNITGLSFPNIPDSFLPVDVKSLYLKYINKTKQLSISSDLDYSFSVGEFFTGGEGKLQLEFDSTGLKDGSILVNFNVCGVDMILKIRKEQNGEWSIEGGTALGEKMSIADLTNGLIGSFKNITGLSFPNIPDSFLPVEAKNLYLKYINKTKQLSISSDLDYSFAIGEFFTGGEGKLQLEFDNTGLKDGSIVFKLDVCGVDMELKMTKEQNGEWSIEGGTALGEKMSVANVVDGLIDSLKNFTGISFPDIPDSLLPVEASSLYLKYVNKTKQLSIVSDLDYSFSIGGLFSSNDAKLKFLFENNSLINANASIKFTLFGADMELLTQKLEGEGWQLSGGLADGEEVRISDIIEKLLKSGGLSLPVDLPDFTMNRISFKVDLRSKDFYITAGSDNTWKVPLGITELEIGKISAEFYHKSGKSSGVIKGTAELAGVKTEISYDISQGLIIYGTVPDISTKPLTDMICGADVFDILPLPSSIGSFEIKDISFMINIKQQDMWLKGNIGDLGDAIFVAKKIAGKWGFCVVAMLDTDFEFSSISPFLGFLDTIDLNNLSMVVSSYKGDLSITGLPQLTGTVVEGLNFMMTVDMNKIPELAFINKLVKMSNSYIPVTCSVFREGGAQIDANLVSNIPLGCGLTIKRGALRMRLGKGLPSYSMLLSVLLDIGDQLLFTGEATVFPNGALFSATMEGTWTEPFGIKNVNISNVAVALGFTTGPIPTIGVAGTVEIGKVMGEVGVLLNTINPSQSILHIKFNQLGVSTIFDLCNSSILENLPDYFDPIINTGLKDVEVHIVPQSSYIGQLYYEEGFRAKGTLNLLGLEAFGQFEINQNTGDVLAKGYLSQVNLFNILKISGANGEPNANFLIDVGAMRLPKAHISGCIDFLGLQKYSIYADLSEKGFVFSIYEKLYGLVELELNSVINKDMFYTGGSISFGIGTLGPIKVFGVTLIDAIPINTGFRAASHISVSKDGFSLGLSGNIQILGVTLVDVGFELDVAPSDFRELYDLVVDSLVDAIKDNFANVFGTIGKWARAIAEGVIEFAGNVADVCKNVFNSSMEAAVEAYKIIGKGLDEVVEGLKNIYGAAADTVGAVLKAGEYAVDQIAGALKNVYNLTNEALTNVIKGLGYGIEEIGEAIAAACDLAADVVAAAMDKAGYALEEIAASLNVVYSLADSAVAGIIKGLGYGVEAVSKAITFAFQLGANALAKALKIAGYLAEEVMQGVKAALEVVGDVAAAALKFAGYAVNQIADGLRKIYGAAEEAVTQALKIAGFIASEVAQALKDVFGTGIEFAAHLLKNAGYAVAQIAQGLKSAFNAAVNTVASILKNVGCIAGEVAQALNTVFSAAASIVASALKAAGYAATLVAGALNSVYQLAAEGVASVLKAAGYIAGEIMEGLKNVYGLAANGAAAVLKACGYAVSVITDALKNAYGLAAQGAAEILKGIGFAAGLVAEGLKIIYGLASDAAAQIMKIIGCGINDIASAMKDIFNLAGEGAVAILKGLGYGLNDVGNVISTVFNIGADGIASVLKGAGYAVEQVGDYLRNFLGYSCDAVNDILKGVGYAASAVEGFLKDAFDWVPHIDLPYIDFPHVDFPHCDFHADGW